MIVSRFKLLIFSLPLFFLSACGQDRELASRPAVVKVQTIVFSEVQPAVAYSGFVCGRYESQLSFQVSGKIKSRNVTLGSAVKRGQLLLAIDPRDLNENVRLYAAQLEAARARALLAATEFHRYEQLRRNSVVSQSAYDQYKTSLAAAEQALRQAEAQYKQSLNSLDYANLRADADGVLTAVKAEVDQVAAAGQPVVTLVRNANLEVEIEVSESAVSGLKIGEAVQVNFWALNGLAAPGRIREISPLADRRTRTYTIRISLDSNPPELRLGMTATALINQKVRDEILLPVSALSQTGERPQVWLVQNERLNLRPVTLGGLVGNQARILSGLAPGEVVVVAGVHKLFEGQSVRLMAGE
jgi:RND family efflux transporter MFP subunit